ncbi:hypothetical protein [Kitasatospora sp. NPDC047058]|uniref:hypothetical protein n=1 Tax=Kitasatospora sp. NPDC047058 TaxID=3155620 RepID=UPI0033F2EE21
MNLQWIDCAQVRLTSKLIPSPSYGSHLIDQLANVRVAFDNGFVHIDTRFSSTAPLDPNGEYTVLVVPAAAVESISYQVVDGQPRVRFV